jgi:ParB family chromosome partitioning protein
MFEVPAGGRRYRALGLLVKQKRLAKNALVPCVVRDPNAGISAQEDSLAENAQRADLHPLDQFRAFKALSDQGLADEDIAARFFVTPAVVKQRLRLASVSPKLLDIYAEDGMTLQQLMAFTVTNDHARQEQVWEALAHTYSKEPFYIRRQLTEGAVRASDRRALFVGAEAYEAAGGIILRDLFEHDDGGWLQDPALLNPSLARSSPSRPKGSAPRAGNAPLQPLRRAGPGPQVGGKRHPVSCLLLDSARKFRSRRRSLFWQGERGYPPWDTYQR